MGSKIRKIKRSVCQVNIRHPPVVMILSGGGVAKVFKGGLYYIGIGEGGGGGFPRSDTMSMMAMASMVKTPAMIGNRTETALPSISSSSED